MSGGDLSLWGLGLLLGVQIQEADRSDKFPMKMATENTPCRKPLQCFGDSRWTSKKSSTLHNTFLLEGSECKLEFLTSNDTKTKHAESNRRRNHQYLSFMFSINGNMKNLSLVLRTNE